MKKKSGTPMKIDMENKVFGRLLVKSQDSLRTDDIFWICICECGNTKSIRGTSLRANVTSSCGCLQKETSSQRSLKHGMFGTASYRSWAAMLQRCRDQDPESPNFKTYAARGITVDPKWEEFKGFYEDMGDRPEGCTLDRVDFNKGYYKENCRWATLDVQANNKRNARMLTLNGETLTLEKWSEKLGIAKSTIHCRLRDGRTVEEALSQTRYGKPRNG
jgi:hypothetical protein